MTWTDIQDSVFAWLSAPGALNGAFALLAEPLGGLLRVAPETRGGVILLVMVNAYIWTTLARFAYSVLGRWFGFYNPAHFHSFLWVPWRPVWKKLRIVLRWREEVFRMGRVASARWASLPDRLCLVYKPGHIFLGRHRAGGIAIQQPAGCDGERHVTMIAGPGSGKTSHAISWVTMHPGNAFIIDPKGLIARVTARRKGKGGPGVFGQGKKVRILDPLHQVKEHPCARWNVFDVLREAERRSGSDAVVRYAVKIAEGLIVRYAKENPFWPGACKELLTGAILDIYTKEPPERQTLPRLYDLLCNGLPEECQSPKENPITAWLWRMKKNTAFDGIIAASASTLADAGEQTYGNILVSAREQLQWLKLPEVRAVCKSGSAEDGTDVNLAELVTGSLVLYVCAPATDVRGPMAGWFRLLTVISLYIFEDLQKRLKHPCLFLLDEFPALGKIESIQIAAGLMRSMGVRLAIIAQDLGQLHIYDNYETFLGSAEACLFMATNHQETLSYIERALGVQTIHRKIKAGWAGNNMDRYELREEPLMRAEAIKRVLGRGNIITIRPGDRPLITKRTSYFDYMPTYFFDNDSDHKENLRRRPARQLFNLLLPGKSEPAPPLRTAPEA